MIGPARILLAATLILIPVAGQTGAIKTPKESPLARVVVMGASVSAGFGNGLKMADVIHEAIRIKHDRPRNLASATFFLRPQVLLKRVLRKNPTMLIGCDLLFWFCYGPHFGKGARLQKLNQALALLDMTGDRLLVVGDIPDMRHANPRMLPPMFVPSPQVLAQANKRIRAWAAKRKRVVVLPLAKWVKEMREGMVLPPDPALEADRKPLPISSRQGMQWDQLHTTRAGTLALAVRTIRLIRSRVKGIKPQEFHITLDRVEKEFKPVKLDKKKGKGKPGQERAKGQAGKKETPHRKQPN